PKLYSAEGYLHHDRRGAGDEAVAAAVERLAGAGKAVIVAGNGVRVSRATQPLAELAELLDCPVVTTGSGKGLFPESHPLAGGVIGDYGLAAASALLGDADTVLAVGTRLAPGDTLA